MAQATRALHHRTELGGPETFGCRAGSFGPWCPLLARSFNGGRGAGVENLLADGRAPTRNAGCPGRVE
jgi:hypothetical protein